MIQTKQIKAVNRLLSITMTLAVAFALIYAMPLTASAEGETGTPDYTWYGDGSTANYTIGNGDELAGLANIVNGTDGRTRDDFNDKTIILTGGIDLSIYGKGTLSFNGGKGWFPIGTYSEPFRGVFDGRNHEVIGLYINDEEGNYEDTGLFGDVFVGTVKNLSVIDVEINGGSYIGGVVGYIQNDAVVENCYVSGKISGGELIGGVVGSGYGSVIDCYSECDIRGNEGVGGLTGALGGSVENCYATGDVSGESNIGGLVGNLYNGNVKNCYATGTVSGSRYTGGLVGVLDGGSVKNCYVTGNVNGTSYCIGGIAGIMSLGNIENCYVIGDITGDGSNSYRVGGVAGETKNSSVINSYTIGKVRSESDCVGGVAGEITSSLVESCYATGEIIGKNAVGGIIGKIGGISTVQNCVALNPGVSGSGSDNHVGRVTGFPNNSLFGNYAWNDMTVEIKGGADKNPLDDGVNGIDGEDVTMEIAKTAAFWTGTMDWKARVWSFKDGNLPVLKWQEVFGVAPSVDISGDPAVIENGDTNDVSFDVTLKASYEGILYVAVYAGNKMLAFENLDIDTPQILEEAFGFTVPAYTGYTVKAFYWSGDTMDSYCPNAIEPVN